MFVLTTLIARPFPTLIKAVFAYHIMLMIYKVFDMRLKSFYVHLLLSLIRGRVMGSL